MKKIDSACKEGFMTKEEFDKAVAIIHKKYAFKRLIFNNGDYYPRNIIPNGNKVYVVDWQSWDNDFRANIIDFVENVAAFAYIHMWENQDWQSNFLKQLRRQFFVNKDKLRLALMLKVLDQFIFFGKNSNSAKGQLNLLKRVLDEESFELIWKKSRPELKYLFFKIWRRLIFS